MPSISIPLVAAGVGAAGAVGSAVIGSSAAKDAASTQAAAADRASQNQMAMFQQVQAGLQPYMSAGTTALQAEQALTGTGPGGNPLTSALGAPFNPTMASLAATPGYQFTLDQGTKAAQNSQAAQGLGASGSAIKAGVNYAEGLAGTTYQQQFQNHLAQNQQLYNMVMGPVSIGENAAAQTGNMGIQSQTNANQYLTSGAAASAAGTVGAANAIGGGISSGTGAVNNALMLSYLNKGGMYGDNSSYYGGYNYGSPDLASAASAGVGSGLTFNPATGEVA